MSATRAQLRADVAAIGAHWDALVQPGDVHEVRIPKTKKHGPSRLFGTVSGYFDNRADVVSALQRLTGEDAEAAYFTLNPVAPALLARAKDHFQETTTTATSADTDVTRRKNLLIDIDPPRPAGISSTDNELAAALETRDDVRAYLDLLGWPEPVYAAMTGNGGALVYRVDLPNDETSTALVVGVLRVLGEQFDTDRVKIDQTVSNAARLTKVIGTVAAKGDDCPELGRPWRVATAEYAAVPAVVSVELLQALAGDSREESPRPSGKIITVPGRAERTWSVEKLLDAQGIGFAVKPWRGGTVYLLDACLVSQDHADGARIIEFASGALDYVCHHARCRGKGWRDARAALGLGPVGSPPGAGAFGAEYRASANGHASNGTVSAAPSVDDEDVPPFPTETLPEAFRALVGEVAASMVVPADYIAVPLLVLAGATIGDALELELKPGWREGTNLSAAVVGPPGSKKTPATAQAARPVYRLQKRLARDYDAALADHEEALAAWEGANKKERGPKPKPPDFAHLITTDATTEALAPMLLRAKGVVLFRDELTGWVRSMDQYRSGGKGADRQHYLSMWSRTLIKVDRKGSQKPIVVPRPCLSVVGGIQPDLLPELADAAQREDGFLDRLLWSYPNRVADYWTPAGTSLETVRAVDLIFDRLYALQRDEDEDGEPIPHVVRLGDEAAELWADWYTEHAAETAAETFPKRLGGPWAKLPAQLARLTLILHALRTNPVEDTVGKLTLAAAADLVEYFKAHAKRAYRHLAKQRKDRVLTLLQALKTHGPMNQRDILHEVFKRNVPAEWIRTALENLEECGLVTREIHKGDIGRPGTVWSAT